MVDPEDDALRNQIKLRLMLAGVDVATVEGLDLDDPAPGAGAVDLMRTSSLWGDDPPVTIHELAERAGLDVELCRRARMLLGLPDPGDEPLCRVQEIEAVEGVALGLEMFGAEPVLHFARVLGSALAAVAEGSLSVFGRALTDRAENDEADALTGDSYTLAAFDAVEAFQIVPMVLQIVAKLQFDLATERLTTDPGQPRWAAVGFVDLTGSTVATEVLGVETMAAALTRFEEWAVELAVGNGGRVVKYIGDEVMFIAPEIASAADVATGLIRRVAEDPVLRTARAGVAYGPVLSRDGDWFGSTVNLASRLVDKARPGAVLLSGDGVDAVPGAAQKGRRRLRDVRERVDVWRIG